MENQRQKYVNLVFLAVAFLVASITFAGFSKLSAVYNLESSIKQIDLFIRLGSIVLGAMAGFGLYFNNQSNAFMNEVVLEMSRVTWPTTKETTNSTIFVIIFVILAGAILGLFDSLWSYLINWLIK